MNNNTKDELLLEQNLNKYGLAYNEILQKEKGIKVKRVNDYFMYRYNQIDENCDFGDEITQECRSIIFKYNSSPEIEPRFKRVCVPFYKFFNYNEPISERLYNRMKDEELHAYEKIDGAMIMVWFDEYWHISTSGNINASDAIIYNPKSCFKTYYDMFEYCVSKQNLDYNKLDKNCTYIFEIVGKYTRIIVPYNMPAKIYHIGTRNNLTLKENFDFIGIEQPKVFKTKGMFKIMDYINKLTTNDENFEGLVIRDDDYNRLKVKPDIYFHLSFLNNNGDITPKRIMNMVMNGEEDELLAYFPEYTEEVQEWKTKKSKCCEKLKNEILWLFENRNLCLPENRIILVDKLKQSEIQGFILQASSDIHNEILKKEDISNYANAQLSRLYEVRRKSFFELIDKF